MDIITVIDLGITVLGSFLSTTFVVFITGNIILERYGIPKASTAEIKLGDLAMKGIAKTRVTIARRILFFGHIYYVPYTNRIRATQHQTTWVLHHPAFRWGKFEFPFEKNANSLSSFNYWLVPRVLK